jgi:hypothetical protein
LSCCPMQRHPRRALSTSRRAERVQSMAVSLGIC